MNTTLTFSPSEMTAAQPKRPTWFDWIESFFASLFSTAEDPAAFRYAAGKYDGAMD